MYSGTVVLLFIFVLVGLKAVWYCFLVVSGKSSTVLAVLYCFFTWYTSLETRKQKRNESLQSSSSFIARARALFRNKSGTTELDTGPNTEESKPEGRLTRGWACRKLGGPGSSPKNTSIVETLRDFSVAYRHHLVKQQRARIPWS